MENKDEKVMESAGEAVEYARQYLKQQGEYIRLEVAERIAKITGPLVTLAIIASLFGIIVLIFSFGIVAWLSNILDSQAKAYFLVGGIYLVLAVIIYINRVKWITNLVLRIVLDAFFESEEERQKNEQ
ncbi:MAG TPA: phage holin family protein [Saprospiraceae bacterium]|nr:phage holin family protein [Saprospiraceae bacterium]MCB9269248.1 phage holin family protein [Lewinellaceae bacterium]HPG06736.1 phage holin family protein [Saprospiraceae bacterium]HPQ98712.1 phage holin family protein [Saprospiraceae bacterium]HRV86117.1 phage holin family protein [Saprospiraceae bacterium]